MHLKWFIKRQVMSFHVATSHCNPSDLKYFSLSQSIPPLQLRHLSYVTWVAPLEVQKEIAKAIKNAPRQQFCGGKISIGYSTPGKKYRKVVEKFWVYHEDDFRFIRRRNSIPWRNYLGKSLSNGDKWRSYFTEDQDRRSKKRT